MRVISNILPNTHPMIISSNIRRINHYLNVKGEKQIILKEQLNCLLLSPGLPLNHFTYKPTENILQKIYKINQPELPTEFVVIDRAKLSNVTIPLLNEKDQDNPTPFSLKDLPTNLLILGSMNLNRWLDIIKLNDKEIMPLGILCQRVRMFCDDVDYYLSIDLCNIYGQCSGSILITTNNQNIDHLVLSVSNKS